MGWRDETTGHEGYVVCTFADGMLGSGGSADAITVSQAPDGELLPVEQWSKLPSSAVVGWQVACDCPGSRTGWLSDQEWARVANPAKEDIARGQIYATDEGVRFVEDRDDLHEVFRATWRKHVERGESLAELRSARAAMHAAERRLDLAVSQARSQGVSWAEIGRATGMTRQSAHGRWADPPPI